MNQPPSTQRFRPATNADRKEIETLIFGILNEHGLEPSPESTDADLADLEGFYSDGDGFFDVVVDNSGKIVGTVAIHRTENDLCELRKMYLAKEVRGIGLGRDLIDHAIERAREMGFNLMWLETAHSLKTARRLYESYGFRVFEPPHKSARCDFAMMKEL